MKKNLFYIILVVFLNSCAMEKSNISPLTSTFTSDNNSFYNLNDSYNYSIKENTNAAEISNLIDSFPVLKNELVNKEIKQLKYYLQNYLYAVEAYNQAGKDRALTNIEKSYKKLQKLRKNLSPDEDFLINRYLVKIKTNIATIESLPQKKT